MKSNFFLTVLLVSLSTITYDVNAQKNPYAMFRGNLQHSGIYPSPEVRSKPTLLWRFKTGDYVNSSCAIDGDHIFFGSGDGNLYCVHATTGKLVWKFKTSGAVDSSPAVDNGVVFFGSLDGNFYAVDASKGTLKWSFKTGGEKYFPPKKAEDKNGTVDDFRYDTWISSPAVKNKSVYFGSGDGNFYALNKSSGKLLWKIETGSIIHSSPAIAFGNVYFGGWDTFLHCVDENTGKEKWRFKTGEDTVRYNQTGITSSPVIVDHTLFVGCRDSHIYSIDASTGKLNWKRYNDNIWVSSTPLVFEDKVLYSAQRPNKFIALNKVTGDSTYKYRTRTGTSGSLSLAGRLVYHGDLNGFLNANDFDSGELLWSFQLPTSVEDPLKILGKDFRIDQEGFTAAVEKYKGVKGRNEVRFSLGAIHSSPVIKDGIIYFGSYDGYFYALK